MKNKIFLSLLVIVTLLFITGCDVENENQDLNYDNSNKTEKSSNNGKKFSMLNENQNNNFIKSLKECNIDSTKVHNLIKKDDWSNGQRYSFSYKNDTLWLYLNDDDTVSSINLNLGGLHIYDEKYESLDYEDYYISFDDTSTMQLKAEERIDELLKYPSTGKYTWNSYQRTKEYYKIVGSVKAKNSLNLDVENIIEVEFKKEENFSIVYVGIDGQAYYGKLVYPEINRKERIINDDSTTNEITLSDGIAGNYGKYDTMDGNQYLRYYIPNGKYKVTALVKNSMFYVESIAIHKEDGYDTPDTYNTIKLSAKGDTSEIEISDGQCISLVMGTKVKLVTIDK